MGTGFLLYLYCIRTLLARCLHQPRFHKERDKALKRELKYLRPSHLGERREFRFELVKSTRRQSHSGQELAWSKNTIEPQRMPASRIHTDNCANLGSKQVQRNTAHAAHHAMHYSPRRRTCFCSSHKGCGSLAPEEASQSRAASLG